MQHCHRVVIRLLVETRIYPMIDSNAEYDEWLVLSNHLEAKCQKLHGNSFSIGRAWVECSAAHSLWLNFMRNICYKAYPDISEAVQSANVRQIPSIRISKWTMCYDVVLHVCSKYRYPICESVIHLSLLWRRLRALLG